MRGNGVKAVTTFTSLPRQNRVCILNFELCILRAFTIAEMRRSQRRIRIAAERTIDRHVHRRYRSVLVTTQRVLEETSRDEVRVA
jgi:hypothetical protein